MNQVALREDRATGGDGGRLGHAAHQGRIAAIQAQASGLFVEKRSSARRTHGVGGVVLEVPLGVELHESHRAAADVDDVANLGELGMHDANLAGRDVQPPGLKRLAEAGRIQPAEADGVAGRKVKLA